MNLAPLSRQGIEQIERAARDLRLVGADLILASPFTRVVQTASILSRALDVPIAVETDLHEWLANRAYVFDPDDLAEACFAEYTRLTGRWPQGEVRRWESAEQMRDRVLGVLRRYCGMDKVIVAGHGMMIQAVTGMARHPENGEIVAYELILFSNSTDTSARAFSILASAHSTHRSAATPRSIPVSQNVKFASYPVPFSFENSIT